MVDRGRARGAIRTAVVWEVLRAALEERAGGGRQCQSVLDAGGGTGGFAVPLAELGHQVVVVDPSPDALAALERRVAEAGVGDRVRAVQGDAIDAAGVVGDQRMDVVLCHGVLEHVDDPTATAAALCEVLAPGGLLSVLVANRHALVLSRALAGHFAQARHALEDPAGRWGPFDPTPRRYSREEIVDLLVRAGVQPRSVHGIRVFSDLVPGALLDLEPDNVDELLALESAAAAHPVLGAIATQLHVLATVAVSASGP
ncbi:MAG: methyltransferase domain-containing protein [Actinomycetes bacterium]